MSAFEAVGRYLVTIAPGYLHSRGRVLAIFSALTLAMLLAAMDQTVVATALPQIVASLGGVSSYAWVFTAYLVCQTLAIPIYGRLGDAYGRRKLLIVGISILVAGSALAATAQTLTQLVVFRCIQGIGAGGVIPLVLAIVAGVVPARERGRYQAFTSLTFAAASVMGPTVGGVLVDNASWRWIFVLNVPIGVLAIAALLVLLPPRRAEQVSAPIDYTGAALLALGTGTLLIALVSGGRAFAWGSPEQLAVVGISAGAWALFVVVERRVANPILPFGVVRDTIVAAGAVGTALTAFCMFGTTIFVPLFVQGVIGGSATASGVVLVPLVAGAAAASIAVGQWLARTGRYREPAFAGSVVMGLGMLLLWTMDTATTEGEVARNVTVVGIAVGLLMPVFLVAAQNAVRADVVGTTTAFVQFARGIGQTLGVTVFGVVVAHGLSGVARDVSPIARHSTSAERAELVSALRPAFLLGVGAAGLMLLSVARGLHHRPLAGHVRRAPPPPPPP